MTIPKGVSGQASPLRSATNVNQVIDAANLINEQMAMGRGGRNPSREAPTKIRNDTGGNLPQGHVVKLGNRLLASEDRSNQKIWFEGLKPADPIGEARYGILLAPIESEKLGPVALTGSCWAMVDVKDTGHRFATPVDDSTLLESSDSGSIEMLEEPEETGEQPIFVRFAAISPERVVKVTLTEAISSGSATCNLLDDEGEDTGEDIEVYAWINYTGGENGTKAMARWCAGMERWEFCDMDCEEE